MADIFISYSSKDKEKADQLTELLASAGLSVWIDKTGIEAATSWSEEIVNALDACKAFVVMLSPSSIESKNVVREVALAFEKNKKILPLDLEPVQLPASLQYHLAGLQRTSMMNIDSIIRALGKIGLEAKQIPTPKIVRETDSRKSLMVLPFEDLSPTQDNGWFADGLTGELIDALAHIRSIRLIDRKTSMGFKNHRDKTIEIAKELQVRYFIDGSVRKFGEQIKISTALLDVVEGEYLWQESHKGVFADIFDIQESVAQKVVTALKLHLSNDEMGKVSARETNNAEAYEVEMLARSQYLLQTKQGIMQSIKLHEEAITLDPLYAKAYSGLANALISYYKDYSPDETFISRAEQAIYKALELKPDFAPAYNMKGKLHLLRNQFDEAIEAGKKAISIEPENSTTHGQLAVTYSTAGHYADAIQEFRSALTYTPDDLVIHYNLVLEYHAIKDSENRYAASCNALPHFIKYLRRHPDDQTMRMAYSVCLFFAEKYEESKQEIEELLKIPRLDGMTYFNCASLYLEMQDHQRALDLYTIAVEHGYRRTEFFYNDPDAEPLKKLPGYQTLLEKIKEKKLPL